MLSNASKQELKAHEISCTGMVRAVNAHSSIAAEKCSTRQGYTHEIYNDGFHSNLTTHHESLQVMGHLPDFVGVDSNRNQ